MHKLIRFVFLLLCTLFFVTLHFFVAYTLPYPFDKINILFVYLLFYLLLTESGTVVWMAFFTHIFIEVFPSNTFGVTLMSSSLAFLLSYWFHTYYITNKRWYGGLALMIFTLFSYRVLYSFLLFFFHRFAPTVVNIQWTELWELGLSEILLTSSLFIILYFLLFKFSKTFRRLLSK